MTREEWLKAAIDELRPLFAPHEPIPEVVRISVGWPGGRGKKRGVVGQCWFPQVVEDGTPAVFISPVLKDPVEVLVTVTHELVHACGKRQHRGQFGKLAGAVGLDRPWKSTPATPELRASLATLAEKLGPYDHSPISASDGPTVQGTRMLKVTCRRCGYTVRTTRKWLDVGLPFCPKEHRMKPAV